MQPHGTMQHAYTSLRLDAYHYFIHITSFAYQDVAAGFQPYKLNAHHLNMCNVDTTSRKLVVTRTFWLRSRKPIHRLDMVPEVPVHPSTSKPQVPRPSYAVPMPRLHSFAASDQNIQSVFHQKIRITNQLLRG